MYGQWVVSLQQNPTRKGSYMKRSLKPWSNENASHRKLTCVDLRWHQSNGGTSCHKFCTFACLTFLTWYVSYDSPLKRCLKDTFLILLCSNNSQVFASWKNLRWNLNKLKISRKLAQATASHRKLAVKQGTSVQKLKTWDDLRSRLIRALKHQLIPVGKGRSSEPRHPYNLGLVFIFVESLTNQRKLSICQQQRALNDHYNSLLSKLYIKQCLSSTAVQGVGKCRSSSFVYFCSTNCPMHVRFDVM